jgi:ketosteroid isomerase-like protein
MDRFEMKLSRTEIEVLWNKWDLAWNNHDLDSVMEFFHDEIYFENWTGGHARGKEKLREGWKSWFENHGNFQFIQEEMFFDEDNQKLLYRWLLKWPSLEKEYKGKPEERRGVDIIHFEGGKIIAKLTYSKTTVTIEGKRVNLTATGRD